MKPATPVTSQVRGSFRSFSLICSYRLNGSPFVCVSPDDSGVKEIPGRVRGLPRLSINHWETTIYPKQIDRLPVTEPVDCGPCTALLLRSGYAGSPPFC